MDILGGTNNNNGPSKRSHSHTTMVMNHRKKQFRYISSTIVVTSAGLPPSFFTLCVMGTDEIVHVVRHNVLPNVMILLGWSPLFRRPLGQLSMLPLLVLEDDCCVVACVWWLLLLLWLLSVVSEWVACVRTYVHNERQKMTSS
jgi:hypothetical protein